jgi:hypothetical protein
VKWKPDLTSVLLAIVLVFTAASWWRLDTLHSDISAKLQHTHEVPTMQTATTTVTNQANTSITITTTKGSDESDADWLARHVASVAAAKASGGEE